jgi:hypothetical protein
MGYLHLRHTVDWGTFEGLFKSTNQKYSKFWQLNALNLRQLKQQSLNEDNYEAIENFVEYENFLNRSYFHHLQVLLNQCFDMLKSASSNPDFSMEFY